MTDDELIVRYETMLERIAFEHAGFDGRCVVCCDTDDDGNRTPVPWPCRTGQIVNKALLEQP